MLPPSRKFFSTIPSGCHQVLAHHHHHPPAVHGWFPFGWDGLDRFFKRLEQASSTGPIDSIDHDYNFICLKYADQIRSNHISHDCCRTAQSAPPPRSLETRERQHLCEASLVLLTSMLWWTTTNNHLATPLLFCHTWETRVAQNQHMLDLDITRERYACEKHPKPPKRSFMKSSSFSACPLLFAGA